MTQWTAEQPIVSIRDVHKSYGQVEVLRGISMDIMKGEVICIIGPSGSGKSTLIRCINALNDIQAGSIQVEGQEVHDAKLDKLALRRKVGMVFQQYNLFPHKTALQNVMMAPIKVLRENPAEVEARARALLKKVRLEGKENHYPGELSGGQQQRVAIARALVLQPKILLLDEPLSNLDAKLRQQMRGQLKKLQAEVGITTVYVTHDQDEALAMSDRIAVFNRGTVEQVGTPQQVYDEAATEFVCQFVGESSRLGAELLQVLGLDTGRPAYLREEKASLTEVPGAVGVDAVVELASYHGTHTAWTVQAHDTRLRVMGFGHAPSRSEGDQVRVWIRPGDVLQYQGPEKNR